MGRDKKKLILGNVGRMKERIRSLEEELKSERERLESEDRKNIQLENSLKNLRNPCWWDAKLCSRYTEISGLQEAGSRCINCHKIDKKALRIILEEMGLVESEDEKERELKENVDEKLEEAIQDLHEEIVTILNEANVEPSD